MRLVFVVTILLGPFSSSWAGGLAVWVEGANAQNLRVAIFAGVPATEKATPLRLVAKALKEEHAHGSLEARMESLASRLKVDSVLYGRGGAKILHVALWRAGAELAERKVTIASQSPKALKAAVVPVVAELFGDTPTREEPKKEPLAKPEVAEAGPNEAPKPAPHAPTPAPAENKGEPKKEAGTKTAINTTKVTGANTETRTETKPETQPATTTPTANTPATTIAAAPPKKAPGQLVWFAVDGGINARRMSFTGVTTNNLPAYSNASIPWLGFQAALYPLARTRLLVLQDLGAFFDLGRSLYGQSVVSGSARRLNTSWLTYTVGLRERLRFFGAGHYPTLGLSVAYGAASYSFDDGGVPVSETPAVDYRYVRPALDFQVSFSRITVFADGGYRALFATGYVGQRFPHASSFGLDAAAGLMVSLPAHLAVRLTVEYQRYLYTLHAAMSDPYVANAATDEYLLGALALAFNY